MLKFREQCHNSSARNWDSHCHVASRCTRGFNLLAHFLGYWGQAPSANSAQAGFAPHSRTTRLERISPATSGWRLLIISFNLPSELLDDNVKHSQVRARPVDKRSENRGSPRSLPHVSRDDIVQPSIQTHAPLNARQSPQTDSYLMFTCPLTFTILQKKKWQDNDACCGVTRHTVSVRHMRRV